MNNSAEIERLFNSMIQLGRLMAQRAQESREEQMATTLQFAALSRIGEERITVTELADNLKLSKSSATQLVERLVQSKYVVRSRDQKDGRIIRLALTDNGIEHLRKLKKKFISVLHDAFSDIPKRDILELIRIHSEMIQSLKKYERN